MSLTALNEGLKKKYLNDIDFRKEAISNIIDLEVLAQEAEKLKLSEDPFFRDSLSLYRKKMLANLLLEKEISLKLTEKEVKEYYQIHRDIFSTDQVHVQHLLVKDQDEAKRLLALSKDSKNDFQELAERYSIDPAAKNNRGDLGFITHDLMDPEFTRVAFSTLPGQVVGPVHTLLGYHLIKVIQKKIGKPLEFAEVELQVKMALREELIRGYKAKMRRQAKIEVHDQAVLEN